MKLNHLFVLLAALLQCVLPARAQKESLGSVITNVMKDGKARMMLPRRSSIIFIAFDGLAWSDLSCYGQTNFQTPNLDRLAAEGMRFTDYRAGGDDLPAAQAALMAGKNGTLAAGEPTLAARLQKVGYRTGMIGEWALGPEPWTHGFDEFAGFTDEQQAKNFYSDVIWRLDPRESFDPATHQWIPWLNKTTAPNAGPEMIFPNTGGRKGKYLPDLLMTAAANFAQVNQPDFANHYRPFFLFVNLPAPRSVTAGKDDFPVPTDAPFTSEPWPQAAKNRAALVSRLDEGIGRLLEQLTKLHMTNDVAIFVAGSVAPEKFADTNLNFLKVAGDTRGGSSEARLRVPMLVRWPGHVPARRVSAQPWSAVDVAPTALQIAYAKPPPGMTGISMLPALVGAPGTN